MCPQWIKPFHLTLCLIASSQWVKQVNKQPWSQLQLCSCGSCQSLQLEELGQTASKHHCQECWRSGAWSGGFPLYYKVRCFSLQPFVEWLLHARHYADGWGRSQSCSHAAHNLWAWQSTLVVRYEMDSWEGQTTKGIPQPIKLCMPLKKKNTQLLLIVFSAVRTVTHRTDDQISEVC